MIKMKYTVIGINAHLAKIHMLEVETTTAQNVGVSLSGLAITANNRDIHKDVSSQKKNTFTIIRNERLNGSNF